MREPENLLAYLRRCYSSPTIAGQSDGELLDEFSAGGPGAGPAFEELLRRHGPMVSAVCGSTLPDGPTADDAFQATFLILIRRAGGLRLRKSLASWLFGVARRVAYRARSAPVRRARLEVAAARPELLPVADALMQRETLKAVHDEIDSLSGPQCAAFVSCVLEGLTYEQAASRLGWTEAAVRGRLARARAKLRARLTRRGLGPDIPFVVPQAVPCALRRATAAAADVVTCRVPGAVADSIQILVKGGTATMMTKLKTALTWAFAGSALSFGAVFLSAQPPASNRFGDPPGYDWSANQRLAEIIDSQTGRADAEVVISLAREAQKRQEAGDPDGALAFLAKLDDATKQWTARVKRELDRAAAAKAEAKIDWDMRTQQKLRGGGDASVRPGGAKPDLEARIEQLEKQMKRLIDALEHKANDGRAAPANKPGM
jgi:RNA polymerase sigma factor (sigma-70 family)